MKNLDTKNILETSAFYIFIIINGIVFFFSIYKEVSLITLLLAPLALSIFSYFTLSAEFYRLEYDNRKVIITNQLKPFFHKEYTIEHLKKTEIGYASKHGTVLKICYDDRIDVFGVNYLERGELEKVVKEINSLITN